MEIRRIPQDVIDGIILPKIPLSQDGIEAPSPLNVLPWLKPLPEGSKFAEYQKDGYLEVSEPFQFIYYFNTILCMKVRAAGKEGLAAYTDSIQGQNLRLGEVVMGEGATVRKAREKAINELFDKQFSGTKEFALSVSPVHTYVPGIEDLFVVDPGKMKWVRSPHFTPARFIEVFPRFTPAAALEMLNQQQHPNALYESVKDKISELMGEAFVGEKFGYNFMKQFDDPARMLQFLLVQANFNGFFDRLLQYVEEDTLTTDGTPNNLKRDLYEALLLAPTVYNKKKIKEPHGVPITKPEVLKRSEDVIYTMGANWYAATRAARNPLVAVTG